MAKNLGASLETAKNVGVELAKALLKQGEVGDGKGWEDETISFMKDKPEIWRSFIASLEAFSAAYVAHQGEPDNDINPNDPNRIAIASGVDAILDRLLVVGREDLKEIKLAIQAFSL